MKYNSITFNIVDFKNRRFEVKAVWEIEFCIICVAHPYVGFKVDDGDSIEFCIHSNEVDDFDSPMEIIGEVQDRFNDEGFLIGWDDSNDAREILKRYYSEDFDCMAVADAKELLERYAEEMANALAEIIYHE